MAQQLTLDLPADVRLEAEDFFVSDANEQAFAMVLAPEAWPDGKLALVGEPSSGKTHLARLFANQVRATIIVARDARPDAPLPGGPLVVEDCDALPADCEEWLFHAHNHLRAMAQPLLVTGQTAPARWNISLPDLASRLSAATTVTIGTPDASLLTAVLLKHFQDRQLSPTPDAMAYLIKHIPRSFQAVGDVVNQLDREALAQSKALTRPFVRAVLDSMGDDAR
ncbi:HdaA/DnaA family protein [Octadecabacter algicola]|uniref:HdaA/DnaA family protein n=1 Tax=Octadecabacter algicola TaxID=2909342 RepID=UPI001F27FC0E|nr:DnaA/Hda family protein [Octadecabacter algicola]